MYDITARNGVNLPYIGVVTIEKAGISE